MVACVGDHCHHTWERHGPGGNGGGNGDHGGIAGGGGNGGNGGKRDKEKEKEEGGTVGVATQRAPYRWLVMDRLLRVSSRLPNHATSPHPQP